MKNFKSLKKLCSLISAKFIVYSFFILLLYFIIQLANVFIPLILKMFIDTIQTKFVFDFKLVLIYILCILLSKILFDAITFLNTKLQFSMTMDLSTKLFSLFNTKEIFTNNELSAQELTTITFDYAENSLSIFNIEKSKALFDLLRVIFATAMIFYLHYICGIITLVAIFLSGIMYIAGNKVYMKRQKTINEEELQLYDFVEDAIEGRYEIKNFKRETAITAKIQTLLAKLIKKINAQIIHNFTIIFLLQDYVRIFFELAMISMSLFLVIKKEISVGSFIILVQYSTHISNPLEFFSVIFASLQNSFTDMEMIVERLPQYKNTVLEKLDMPIKKITVDNFTFEHNKFYVLEGDSGSGKTTLLKKIITQENAVRYISNADSEFSPTDQIFYLPQTAKIFPMNLYDNITLGEKNISDEFYAKIISTFALDDLNNVDELSEAEISGGQKSRISFARSLAFKNDWLLLDEPLTGIEYDLLHKIINFASECFKTKTVILVSHNDTIKKMFSENFDMSLCSLSAH